MWKEYYARETASFRFIQRNRALQIIAINKEYSFFYKKKKSATSFSAHGSHQRALPHCSRADRQQRIASFYTKYNRWCRMFGKDKHFPFNCGFSPGAACCGKVIAVLPDHTEMSDMQLL